MCRCGADGRCARGAAPIPQGKGSAGRYPLQTQNNTISNICKRKEGMQPSWRIFDRRGRAKEVAQMGHAGGLHALSAAVVRQPETV